MLIQFHLLQNYAPSNLNRDDTGSPKDAIFGGIPRGRISSQCLKRNIRKSDVFEAEFKDDKLIGFRTQRMPFEVSKELKALGATDDEIQAIVTRLMKFGKSSKDDKKPDDSSNDTPEDNEPKERDEQPVGQEYSGKVPETKQLIFLSPSELRPFAEKILALYRQYGAQKWADKKTKIEDIEKELGQSMPRSVDIALFGRMTTSQAFKNVQASAQVAHALSTNALKTEFDYYTAMDDLKPDNEPGADMIGDVEFNSCTYYKYLNVHWENLVEHLGDDKEIALRAVLALLEAAALSHPTGKQNSFGAFNPPDFVLVEVSERNLPVNYANAFLVPVRGNSDGSLLVNSVDALDSYVEKLSKVYNLTPERAHISVSGSKFHKKDAKPSLDDLKKWLGEQLQKA